MLYTAVSGAPAGGACAPSTHTRSHGPTAHDTTAAHASTAFIFISFIPVGMDGGPRRRSTCGAPAPRDPPPHRARDVAGGCGPDGAGVPGQEADRAARPHRSGQIQ